ncbi:coniferyl aldehyde dehydrogenase [Aurantimonas sp. A2-1-M11]|uniref:coniferyl aldehyde dehydrogenase n=1 Tax=Aurantimonas sp. A2-1-M11 TaxID=3113712 RepID=UPI002F957E72
MSDETMQVLFDRQRQASRTMPAPDAAARREALATLRRLIVGHVDAIADAISADFGTRSKAETELLEISPTLNAIRHAGKSLGRWMKPQRRGIDITFQPGKAWVRHEPLGVVGIMSPWNYPLILTLAPLVDALAAGNRVLLKPSELTPRFADLLQRVVAEHFSPDQVAVVVGDVEVAKAFSALPFDHLLFTGSTAIGRQVMRAAAENLTPVTLELGGKSPAIVCPDYSVSAAARSIAFGKWLNAGQTCIAPDYVLVPADRVEAFAEAAMAAVRSAYPALAENADYTSIVSTRHQARLQAALAQAEAAGASVYRHSQDAEAGAGKLAPAIVLGAPDDGVLMREEIFGPILPVVPYRDLDEALAIVNARERPLALYCFTGDRRTEAQVLDGAISGGVTVNGTLLHIAQDNLPFGGIGPSGMGAYHGRDGFLRFSHARAVYRVGPINVFERLGPPWGRLARMTARIMLRR